MTARFATATESASATVSHRNMAAGRFGLLATATNVATAPMRTRSHVTAPTPGANNTSIATHTTAATAMKTAATRSGRAISGALNEGLGMVDTGLPPLK